MTSSGRRLLAISIVLGMAAIAAALTVAASNAASSSPEPRLGVTRLTSSSHVTAEVRSATDAMMRPGATWKRPNAISGISSNPYDYTVGNAEYAKLVAMGYGALPALESELDRSADSGLREYLICIAIEEITQCNLKQFGDSNWETASTFKVKWPKYLASMPTRVNGILTSNLSAEDKGARISQLGAPAVPFVIDDAGLLSDTERSAVTNALAGITRGSRMDTTLRGFADHNADQIASLRAYVTVR